MNDRLAIPFESTPAFGAALEVAPGVLWMRIPMPMRPLSVNVFALEEDDGWSLIDTGTDTEESRAVWARLLAGPLGGKPVRRVFVTHHHCDHIGLAGWFQARGAELWASRTAWLTARVELLDSRCEATAEEMAFWRDAGAPEALVVARAAARPFPFHEVVHALPPGFRRLRDEDTVEIGGRCWRIGLGNGHAPGHATFWSQSDRLVLGGDQFLADISPNLGVHEAEPLADPVAEWRQSCRRFLVWAREEHLVLPGHRSPFTGLPGRLEAMLASSDESLERLRRHLDRPRHAVDCFPALFGRPIGETEYNLALAEAVAHLNHLLLRGVVSRARAEDGAWLWSRC